MNQTLLKSDVAQNVFSEKPELKVISNTDDNLRIVYKIARIIYAETKGESLPVKEAFSAMIQNRHNKLGVSLEKISEDSSLFNSLVRDSIRNKDLLVDTNDAEFSICLRLSKKIMLGNIFDSVYGAVRFHRDNENPAWATAEGYIYQLNDFLFYL